MTLTADEAAILRAHALAIAGTVADHILAASRGGLSVASIAAVTQRYYVETGSELIDAVGIDKAGRILGECRDVIAAKLSAAVLQGEAAGRA